MYDSEKLTALSILGLIYGYRRAARFARTIKYDAMLPEARYRYGLRYPSKSLLHHTIQRRICEEYLDAVLRCLWQAIRGLAIVKFIFCGAVEFTIDDTGLPTRWLRLTTRKEKPMLVSRKYEDVL